MSSTPTKPNYAPFEANIDGAIAAANYLMSEQGYGIRDYPNNMGGLVAAILNLNIGQSNVGITPSQWMPVRDEDGNILEDSWDPPPTNGTLWFDTRQGKLMVWLNDGFYQANGVGAYSSVGSNIPEEPVEGQTWLDTDNYIYYIYDGHLWHELAAIEGATGSGSGSGGGVSSAAILDLQQQIDNISIDFTPEEITALQNQFTELTNSTNNQLASMQTDIDAIDKPGIEAKFSELEAQLAVHTTNITAVETTATDLSGRLSSAETEIISNTDAITAVATDLDAAEANITTVETALAAAVTNISTVESSVSSVEADLALASGRITTNEANITLLTVDVDAVKADVSALGTTVGTVETNVASLTTSVGAVETGLASVINNIDGLQTDLTAVEDELSNTTTSVSTNQTNITSLQTDLAALTATVSTVESDLATVTSTVSTVETDLTAAEDNITTLTGDIGTVSSDVTELQTKVDTLETQLTATSGELAALRTIYYGDSAPTDTDIQNGDLWVDSSELRLLVRHVGAWFNPDRSANPDDSAETLIINAVNNSATFDEFKTFINANA